MNKKQVILCSLAGALTISVSAAAILLSRRAMQNVRVNANEYTITVGADEFGASDLDEQFNLAKKLVTQELDGVDAPTLNYYLAKRDSDSNLVLAPAGRIYNYNGDAGYSGRITNLVSVTVNYSGGTLFVQEGIAGDAKQYEAKQQLTSGAELNFSTHPNHIMISNSVAETTITNIEFKYTCEEAGYTVDRLGTKYNAKGSDGKIYTITRNGSNITVEVDESTINGTVAVDYNGNFTVSLPEFSGYTGKVSSDYRVLEVTGKKGDVPTINEFNRIYVVDDFESYVDRGVGFTHDKESLFTATNLRSAYYVDAKDTSYVDPDGTTWITGSDFKVAKKDANFLNLKTNVKHGGNKAITLQGRYNGWVRLWTVDTFNEYQHFNFGKGNRLSFWAHGAYTNPDLTSSASYNVKLRVQAYYQNFEIDNDNRNSTTYGTGTKDFTITAGSDWKEYTLDLNPNKFVYAINIMVDNSGITPAGTFAFIPIDDITISTTPVYEPTKKYEQTATQFTKSYHGTVRIDTIIQGEQDFALKVGLGANGYVGAWCGVDMKATSYSVSGSSITIRTEGDYNGLTFGDWVGTLSNNNGTITIQKSDISGGIKSQIVSSTIVLNEDTVLADDMSSTQLQTIFKRQHKSNDDWADSNNSGHDTVTQNNDYYMSGSSAIRLKPWGDGHIRMIVQPAVAEAQGIEIESIAFWYYVPAGVEYSYKIFAYPTYTPKNSGVVAHTDYECPVEKTHAADDSGWHYINVGLPEGFRKNIAIFVQKNASQTILDYITYF